MILYLIPGLGGDNTGLKAFRTRLEPAVRCEVLEFVDIRRSCAEIFDIDAIAARLADRILAQTPSGPIRLAGYSMGGVIAVEVARRLRAAGREPAFLALVDAAAVNPTNWRSGVLKRIRRTADGSRMRRVVLFLVLGLDWAGWHRPARGIVRAVRRLYGVRRTEFLHTQFMIDLWRWTFARYRIKPYDGRVILFRAKRERRTMPTGDLGWSGLLPALGKVELDGDHWSILEAPHNVRNGEILIAAMAAATTCAPHAA